MAFSRPSGDVRAAGSARLESREKQKTMSRGLAGSPMGHRALAPGDGSRAAPARHLGVQLSCVQGAQKGPRV